MRASLLLLALASSVTAFARLPARSAAPSLPPRPSQAPTAVLEQFKVAGDGDYLIVPVTINGKRYPFMVDTGCGITVYDVSLRPLMGASAGRRAITGWHRTVEVEWFMPPRARLGKLPLPQGEPAPTYDFTAFRCVEGENIRGVLGMDFLRQYVVCIDFDHETLTLQNGVGQTTARPLPMYFDEDDSRPSIQARVLPQCPPEKFMLDTGKGGTASLRTNLFKTASKLGKLKKTDNSLALSVGYLGCDHEGRLACLKVGEFEHRHVTLERLRCNSLGLGYLSRFHVTFDFPGRQLYLKEGVGFGRHPRPYHSGILLWRPSGEETLVWSVKPGSPAAKAGVKVGDRVLSIAALQADRTRLRVLYQELCSSRMQLRITVQRDNEVLRFAFRPDRTADWNDDLQDKLSMAKQDGPVLWFLHTCADPCLLKAWHERDRVQATPRQPVARVAALLNGEEIDEDEVTAAAYNEYRSAAEEEIIKIRKRKLNEIIEREMILQPALRWLEQRDKSSLEKLRSYVSDRFEKEWLRPALAANGLNDVDVFKQRAAEWGVSLASLRRQWERNAMAGALAQQAISPWLSRERIGLRQVLDYYRSHASEFHVEKSVKWQDLFISAAQHPTRRAARTFAEALVRRIREGEDFAHLSKQHDNGDGSLRPNSEGFGTTPGTIRPSQLEEVLFRMKEGEVALVEMEQGFHIVKLVRRQENGTRPLDHRLQKTIHDKLYAEEYRKEVNRMIAQLRQDAVVIVYDTVPQLQQPTAHKPDDRWRKEKKPAKSRESAPFEKSYLDELFSSPLLDTKPSSNLHGEERR